MVFDSCLRYEVFFLCLRRFVKVGPLYDLLDHAMDSSSIVQPCRIFHFIFHFFFNFRLWCSYKNDLMLNMCWTYVLNISITLHNEFFLKFEFNIWTIYALKNLFNVLLKIINTKIGDWWHMKLLTKNTDQLTYDCHWCRLKVRMHWHTDLHKDQSCEGLKTDGFLLLIRVSEISLCNCLNILNDSDIHTDWWTNSPIELFCFYLSLVCLPYHYFAKEGLIDFLYARMRLMYFGRIDPRISTDRQRDTRSYRVVSSWLKQQLLFIIFFWLLFKDSSSP